MLCISAAYASCGVCPSVCLSRSSILSKRVNIKFFTVGQPHHSTFLESKRHGNIPTDDPLTGAGKKIAIFDQYMALESMTAGASTFRRRSKVITLMRLHLFIAQTKGHASVNLVYDSKPGLVRRREHNRISLYALVNLKPKYRN